MENVARKNKTAKEFSFSKFWLRLWNLLQKSQKQIINLLALILLFELTKFIEPYIFKKVVDTIVNFDASHIKFLLYLVFLAFVTEMVVSFF